MQEADRRKDEFLAMLAHELRNPLAPIQNAVQVLKMQGQRSEVRGQRSEAGEDRALLTSDLRPLTSLETSEVYSPAKARHLIDVIDRQVRHMTRLVDDLLDVSRISRGKITLKCKELDLAAVVDQAVKSCRSLITARKHTLDVALPDRPVRVAADPARLVQIVANLLNNAAKYTNEGGRIWLTVEVSKGQKAEGSWQKAVGSWQNAAGSKQMAVGSELMAADCQLPTADCQQAVIRVRDTGIGIPPEMLPKVFDLFTQVNPSMDRAQGGLGIGLTLVRQILEMHGGRVEAYSDGPGRGSEFVVYLPALAEAGIEDRGSRIEDGSEPDREPRSSILHPPSSIPHPPSSILHPPSSILHPPSPVAGERGRGEGGRRILVVDDNVDNADILAMLLRALGHEVHTAYDGPAALETARTWRPEVVLLDIGLPRMTGLEVARRIREDLGLKNVLLAAMTGYGQEEDKRRSLEAGFNAHLVKPVELEVLQALLAQAASAECCRTGT